MHCPYLATGIEPTDVSSSVFSPDNWCHKTFRAKEIKDKMEDTDTRTKDATENQADLSDKIIEEATKSVQGELSKPDLVNRVTLKEGK